MECPADLLIVERVARKLLDTVVVADRDFAESPRPGIAVQHGQKEVQPLRRLGLDHPARFECQRDIVHFVPQMRGRERKAHDSIHIVLYRPGKYLAAGKVLVAVGIDPGASRHSQSNIRVPRDQTHTLNAVQIVDITLLFG